MGAKPQPIDITSRDKGAHYYQCDLQVHTPRDRNWTGSERTIDADRQAYAVMLVQACRDRGLQGIAITDHHDMAFAEYVRTASAELPPGLKLWHGRQERPSLWRRK